MKVSQTIKQKTEVKVTLGPALNEKQEVIDSLQSENEQLKHDLETL